MKTESFTLLSSRIWSVAMVVGVIPGLLIGLNITPAFWSVGASIVLGSALVVSLEFTPLNRLRYFFAPATQGESSASQKNIAEEWTDEMEAHFLELARLEVLGKASSEVKQELDRLTTARRGALNPRSEADITQEMRRNEALRNLLKSLEEYIQTHEPTDSTGSKA